MLRAYVLVVITGCAHGSAPEPRPSVEPPFEVAPLIGANKSANNKVLEKPEACRGLTIPDDQHYVAEGLCARAVALDQGPMRGLTFLPNGDLIGVTLDGVLRRFRDVSGDGVYRGGPPEITEWAHTGGSNGQNCEYDSGFLYCGAPNGVKRYRYDPSSDHGEEEEVVFGVPHRGHSAHAVHIWDGWLYVNCPSEGNSMSPMPAEYDTRRAVIKRFDLSKLEPGHPFSWEAGDVFVRGVRNATAFARAPSGKMFAVINNTDDLRYEGKDVHLDNPGEIVVSLDYGKSYGWPFCFHAARVFKESGSLFEPGTPLRADVAFGLGTIASNKDDTWCRANADKPVSFLQAHSSPLEMLFVTDDAKLLPRWKNGALVTLHGSWDRDPATGYKVVWLPFDAQGRATMPTATSAGIEYPYEVVFGGGKKGEPRDGPWGWSSDGAGEDQVRPVGLAIGPDGALYVSSDNRSTFSRLGAKRSRGAIYRVTRE